MMAAGLRRVFADATSSVWFGDGGLLWDGFDAVYRVYGMAGWAGTCDVDPVAQGRTGAKHYEGTGGGYLNGDERQDCGEDAGAAR
jgi:hypothetical protein